MVGMKWGGFSAADVAEGVSVGVGLGVFDEDGRWPGIN